MVVQLVKAVTQQHCVSEFSLCESRGLFIQSLGSEAQASHTTYKLVPDDRNSALWLSHNCYFTFRI